MLAPLFLKSVSRTSIALALAGGTLVGGALGSSSAAHAQAITFQQVMNSPDDLRLNLAYARQEVAAGRLQQAASALERMLLVSPNWDSARLFYGVVLYRLDDLDGAVRELRLLEGRGLPPALERDRVRYLALATQRTSRLRFSAQYTLGFRLDSNPGRVNNNVDFFPTQRSETDFGVVAASRSRVEYDIGEARGNYLFAETNGYLNDFFNVDRADLIQTRSRAGVVLHGKDLRITPYASYGATFFQYERYRTSVGGGVDTNWTLTSQVDLFLNGNARYEDYQTTDFSTIGSLRDGWRYEVEGGFKWRPTDKQTFKLSLRGVRKEAEFDGYSYDSYRIRVNSLTLLGEGVYLSLTAAYSHADYDEPDNALSFVDAREDDRIYLRAALGAPLETIFAKADIVLPESIGDIVAQIGVTYSSQDSNIPLLNVTNWSGDVLFTKRFSF